MSLQQLHPHADIGMELQIAVETKVVSSPGDLVSLTREKLVQVCKLIDHTSVVFDAASGTAASLWIRFTDESELDPLRIPVPEQWVTIPI